MKQRSTSIKILIEKMKQIKNVEMILTIVVIAIIVSIYASTLSKPQEKQQSEITNEWKGDSKEVLREGDPLEIKLTSILSSIEGAGTVKVMITYESGPEIIPAMNTDKADTTTEENDRSGGSRITKTSNENNRPITIQQRDGSQALVIKEKNPEVRGVIVIAEGAQNIRVKLDLLRAVETVLNVPQEKVEVFSMKKVNKE